MFDKIKRLEARRVALMEGPPPAERNAVEAGIPDSVAHALSMKVEHILKAWNFPGDLIAPPSS